MHKREKTTKNNIGIVEHDEFVFVAVCTALLLVSSLFHPAVALHATSALGATNTQSIAVVVAVVRRCPTTATAAVAPTARARARKVVAFNH